MQRALYAFFLLLLTGTVALATHNRAGEIIVTHKGGSGLTYRVNIITYTESGSAADRDSLELVVSYCGQAAPISRIWVLRNGNITPFPNVAGVQKNQYILESYTLPGPGCYSFSMTDPNRISGIVNIVQSVNVPFALEDTLMVPDPQFSGFNSTPVLLEHPIVYACAQDTFKYNAGAFDPDGDSLTYDLIVPLSGPGQPVGGYSYPDDPKHTNQGLGLPNNFSMDPITGDILWAVPHYTGTYNIAFVVREYRNGQLVGSMIRDMQIIVIDDCKNGPPDITELADTCIEAGTTLIAQVRGTDPDPDQILTLTANGGPFFVSNSPAVFNTTPSKGSVTGTFIWNTNCSHIRPGVYSVIFKVEDNNKTPGDDDQPLSDFFTWNIRVVAPAPTGLQAQLAGNQVTLTWDDPYVCEGAENFRGFSVWRKRGCDSLALDVCESADLSNLGYQRISGSVPVPGFSYTDVVQGTALTYSYRVVAEFAEQVPPPSQFLYNDVSSGASNPVCIELKTDLPLLTNVDVQVTDAVAGNIEVKWLHPDPQELDTLDNPGPYKYELYRHDGFSPGTNSTLIATFTAPTFSGLTADQYLDTGLNTVDGPYTYTIKFFATDINSNAFYEVGESAGASSIYLSTQTGGNQLLLTWEESVPWINYEYYVLREQQGNPGVYDTIAKVADQQYVDQGLVNGEEYCYKIRGYGSYFNSNLPEPLINHSQRKCDIPVDTVPPCVPVLRVSNVCDGEVTDLEPEDLRNILSWSDPCLTCGDCDVVSYNIYYAPFSDEPLQLLATINDPNDTIFIHDNLTSLAGCYAVTAVDSFDNESSLTNKFCVDNCPVYRLPNVFTPNGDGSNDFFTPFLPYYFVDHIEIKIFNRWGNLVFETTDPDINWDGTDQFSGKDVAEGVYYYTCKVYEIRVDGVFPAETPLSGYIHVIRSK